MKKIYRIPIKYIKIKNKKLDDLSNIFINMETIGVNFSKIPYCKNPAIGMDAPKCSEDCCDYDNCNKKEHFEHIANKYNTTPDKIFINSNIQFDKFVIDDREYYREEIVEILKKHKEEEDKKYHKCERCGERYIRNCTFNMVSQNLAEIPDSCSAWGYASTPYIRGFKVLSTCGDGREIKLCDNCIEELLLFLKGK